MIINRHHYIVLFGLMHLLGTSISFWFSTIIEEAMDGYTSKVNDYYSNKTEIPGDVTFKEAVDAHIKCSKNALANFESMDAMPYLYPFSIEYNIILASVWYIIWTNIGMLSDFALTYIFFIVKTIFFSTIKGATTHRSYLMCAKRSTRTNKRAPSM